MDEYIKREAAVKSVLRMRRPENSVAQNRMLSIIQMDMLKLPAAGVAPVVRCKDCDGSQVSDDGKYIFCCRLGVRTGFWDFCSRGAKMDGGDDRV